MFAAGSCLPVLEPVAESTSQTVPCHLCVTSGSTSNLYNRCALVETIVPHPDDDMHVLKDSGLVIYLSNLINLNLVCTIQIL